MAQANGHNAPIRSLSIVSLHLLLLLAVAMHCEESSQFSSFRHVDWSSDSKFMRSQVSQYRNKAEVGETGKTLRQRGNRRDRDGEKTETSLTYSLDPVVVHLKRSKEKQRKCVCSGLRLGTSLLGGRHWKASWLGTGFQVKYIFLRNLKQCRL